MEFTKLATRKDLIYKVTGVDDQGRELFHFVKVDPVKKELFMRDKEQSRMHVGRYADVLLSGFGKPGEEEQQFLKQEFDITIEI